MKSLFKVKTVDREFYEKRLRDWLPDQIIDVHTHVWLKRFNEKAKRTPARTVSWPAKVADENPVAHLEETYRLMFPDKAVTPLMFTALVSEKSLDKANDYIAEVAGKRKFPALVFSHPRWTASELERKIKSGGFLGAKSYLSLAPSCLSAAEIRIFDFFPHHQLEVLNRHGLIMMLHIPRDGRLRDPMNLDQILEIESRYPRIKVIVAHVGRAYCPEDVGDAFKVLAKTKLACFDISANTNGKVFQQLIEAVGPKRILFGSDLPIARMRMRRICENGQYINLVPKGLYGDVSADRHMRAVEVAAAEKLTFFMYEELAAFRRASEAVGLTRADIEDIFHNNAAQLIEAAQPKPVIQQLQMAWPKNRLKAPPAWSLPKGYILRTYQPGDDAAYIRLMHNAGFKGWDKKTVQSTLSRSLPNGLFFVVERKTSVLAATTVATHGSLSGHPFGGELGWVACDPEHRGKNLSYVTCAAVTKRFLDAGYTDIYLCTDDFRLPAIKIYLKQGWVPCFHAPDMAGRWRAVCEKLGWNFASLNPVKSDQKLTK